MSASPRRCLGQSTPRARPTAAKAGSKPRAFPSERRSRSSTSPFQRSAKKTVVAHLGQLDFLHAKDNVILLGPPGTGKSHLAIALSIRACLAGQRVTFRTVTEWVALLPLGMHPETLRKRVRQHEADSGKRPDLPTSQEREEIRRLRSENFEVAASKRDFEVGVGVFREELDEDRTR